MVYIYLYVHTSSTRTRRGGSCLKDIYETFLIYRTCMRHAPAKPVRACTLRNWCRVAHVTFEAPPLTSHLTVFTLHTAPFAINTSHFSLHTALSPIHTSQYKTFPRNTKFTESMSQYYLGAQSLHKALPSTTLYDKACRKYYTKIAKIC